MPEPLSAIAATTKTKRKQRKVKNLVLRGGTWYVRRLVNGKPVRISTHQTDLGHAEKVARDILSKIDKGEVDELIGARKKTVVPTYGAFVKTYYENVSALKKVPRIDHEFLEPTKQAWQNKPLDKITAMDCLAFLAAMHAAKRSVNSIKTMMVLSSCVFNRALAEGTVTKNPWREVPRASKPKRKPRVRVLSSTEEAALMDAMKSDDAKRLVRILAGSGMRIGETLAIVPKKHLDFANKFIRPSGDLTKSGRSRSVPMFPDVESALIEHLSAHDRKLDDTRTLFPLFDHRIVNKLFWRAWHKAKIDRVTPHDCRRTFGTRMAEAGVPMKVLQLWLGHATIEMTAEYYVHIDDDASSRIAQQIAAKQAGGKVVSIAKAK